MAVKQTFERRDPAKLKNHLSNIQIYGGKEPSAEFIESCKDGIHTPLLILPDGTIISGHSRRLAACHWGHKDVPVIVRYDLADDPLMAELVMIQCNAQREKTNDQIAKEAARLKEIFGEFAARREKAGKPCPNVGTGSIPAEKEAKGRTVEKIGKVLGVSKNTAADAAEVGQAIKAAEQSGDTKAAEEIKETVNKKGFSAAKKEVREKKEPTAKPDEKPADDEPKDQAGNVIPKKLRDIFEKRSEFLALSKKLAGIKADAEKLAETDAGAYLRFNTVKTDIENAARHLRGSAPHALCPYCQSGRKGAGDCSACKGIGWVNEGIFKQAPEKAS